jgi:hypothetical protein
MCVEHSEIGVEQIPPIFPCSDHAHMHGTWIFDIVQMWHCNSIVNTMIVGHDSNQSIFLDIGIHITYIMSLEANSLRIQMSW